MSNNSSENYYSFKAYIGTNPKNPNSGIHLFYIEIKVIYKNGFIINKKYNSDFLDLYSTVNATHSL